ncbi:MAG: hypothetical protein ACJAYJ_003033, partial [Saprospiraceae bacterium]
MVVHICYTTKNNLLFFGMSRKNRFIEKLTEAQKSALEKGYRRGKSHLYRRKCHCILLS